MPVTRIIDHLMKVESTNSAQTGLSVLNEQKYEKTLFGRFGWFGATVNVSFILTKQKPNVQIIK